MLHLHPEPITVIVQQSGTVVMVMGVVILVVAIHIVWEIVISRVIKKNKNTQSICSSGESSPLQLSRSSRVLW